MQTVAAPVPPERRSQPRPPRSMRSLPDVGATMHGGHGGAPPSLAALTLAALGVVYGDIGTSPLYTLRACITAAEGADRPASPETILGLLSLMFWSLTMVVTVKYLGFIMKADN